MSTTGPELQSRFGAKRWELPPLILHPFSDQSGPGKLLESSKANLMLYGLVPNDNASSEDELKRKLLDGRYCEIRMLYFIGRDLVRWTSQCAEFVERSGEELKQSGIRQQSFSSLLTKDPPEPVQKKLRAWGVSDFKSIFSRALGLNSIWQELPAPQQLAEDFVRHYYRYADHLFACQQQLIPFTEIDAVNFPFELYASGEYSRLLEKAWEAD